MDPLTILILRTVASTCIRLYITSMFSNQNTLVYQSGELGYKVPRWYMEAGSERVFYAYGTSVDGDEFESLADARRKAAVAMGEHIRLANREIADSHIHYDRASVKQQRLVDLFVRDDGLGDFITRAGTVDKQQLVRVRRDGGSDIRAFVRLALPVKDYVAYQETTLNALKTKLVRQKVDEIMAEIDAEQEVSLQPGAAAMDVPPDDRPATSPLVPVPPRSSVSDAADDAFKVLDSLGD